MTLDSPLIITKMVEEENRASREDFDTAERKRHMIEGRMFVLKKASVRSPETFKLSLNDRFFFMANGYNVSLNTDKTNNYNRKVSLVHYTPPGSINEARPDLKLSQHNPMNNNYMNFNNFPRANWKNLAAKREELW